MASLNSKKNKVCMIRPKNKVWLEQKMEESDLLKEIGLRTRNARLHNNLLQPEFAKKLRMSTKALSQIENGKRPPSGKFLFALEMYYGINGVWLMTGKGKMKTNNRPREINDTMDLLVMFRRLSNEGRCKIVNAAKILLRMEWSDQHKSMI